MPEVLTEEQLLAILQACVRALQRTAAATEGMAATTGRAAAAVEEQTRVGERLAAAVERLADK